MDLRFLEDILILIEEGSLNRAAERRNVTQPAFSRRVQKLENWIGTELLHRKSNKIELHPSLLANEAEIKSLIDRIYGLKQRIAEFDPRQINASVVTQHALIVSVLPEMVAGAKSKIPNLNFRLRAGNYRECVSMFIRGDVSILLLYEDQYMPQLPFDASVERHVWGKDQLIPVVGGKLTEMQVNSQNMEEMPAIVYPPDSYFGRLLAVEKKPFAIRSSTKNTVLESAFSAGIKEMVLAGLGIAWLPVSMIRNELKNGQLTDYSSRLGRSDLVTAYYVRVDDTDSQQIASVWSACSIARPQ